MMEAVDLSYTNLPEKTIGRIINKDCGIPKPAHIIFFIGFVFFPTTSTTHLPKWVILVLT
jgi:hypothetical protein